MKYDSTKAFRRALEAAKLKQQIVVFEEAMEHKSVLHKILFAYIRHCFKTEKEWSGLLEHSFKTPMSKGGVSDELQMQLV